MLSKFSRFTFCSSFVLFRWQDFDKAYQYFMALSNWTMYVADYINHLRTVQPRKMDDSALSLDHVFIPVVPIMFKEGIGEVDHSIASCLQGGSPA